jgi:TonB family protein
VFQWHYAKDASTPPRIQVTIDFRLPPPNEVPAPAPPSASVPNPVTKGVVGSIDVSSLPELLQNMMRSRLASFEGQVLTPESLKALFQAVREVDPHATLLPVSKRPAADGSFVAGFRVVLSAGSPVPIPQSAGGPPPAPGVQRVSIGGDVQSSKLVQMQRPAYPREARQQRIQGIVSFTALIGIDGKIQNLTLISGHPLLAAAAQEAVSQWVYQPTELNGKPVEVATQIDVNFTLAP